MHTLYAHISEGVYYVDRSVLLENTPLIRNYIRDPSGVFSISLLVRILMTSFPAFAWLFVQTVIEKWRAIDRFVKFSEADVKSFSEKQENSNTKNKTSYNLKLFKKCK